MSLLRFRPGQLLLRTPYAAAGASDGSPEVYLLSENGLPMGAAEHAACEQQAGMQGVVQSIASVVHDRLELAAQVAWGSWCTCYTLRYVKGCAAACLQPPSPSGSNPGAE